jgi:hypothetical protein
MFIVAIKGLVATAYLADERGTVGFSMSRAKRFRCQTDARDYIYDMGRAYPGAADLLDTAEIMWIVR